MTRVVGRRCSVEEYAAEQAEHALLVFNVASIVATVVRSCCRAGPLPRYTPARIEFRKSQKIGTRRIPIPDLVALFLP